MKEIKIIDFNVAKKLENMNKEEEAMFNADGRLMMETN